MINASLNFDPDPEVWLVGPTEERPVEEWIPPAAATMVEYFGLTEEQPRERAIVGTILASTARASLSELPYFVLRWRELTDVPLPLFIGLVERGTDQDVADLWLRAIGEDLVEAPLIDEVEAPEGTSIRRSLPYSTNAFRQIVVGAHYVVDTGHPEVVVLAHAATDSPRDIFLAQDDIEAFLQTVRIDAPDGEVVP